MISTTRSFFAVLTAFGFAASGVVCVRSYGGATMDSLSRWAIVLHLGVLILLLPIYAVEYPSIKGRAFFWAGFAQSTPKWVVRAIKLFALFFVFHFVWFLVQSHAASPELKNGGFVLNRHGQVVKVLTQSEYLNLKGEELRLFATGWMFFYFVPTMYWWCPKRQQVRLNASWRNQSIYTQNPCSGHFERNGDFQQPSRTCLPRLRVATGFCAVVCHPPFSCPCLDTAGRKSEPRAGEKLAILLGLVSANRVSCGSSWVARGM
jgi:hypothetical protein